MALDPRLFAIEENPILLDQEALKRDLGPDDPSVLRINLLLQKLNQGILTPEQVSDGVREEVKPACMRVIFEGEVDFARAVNEVIKVGFATGRSEVEIDFNGIVEVVRAQDSLREIHQRFLDRMQRFVREDGVLAIPNDFKPQQQIALSLAVAELSGDEMSCDVRGVWFRAAPNFSQDQIQRVCAQVMGITQMTKQQA